MSFFAFKKPTEMQRSAAGLCVLVFSFWTLMSGVGTFMAVTELRPMTQVKCTIVSNSIEENADGSFQYECKVNYRYEIGGTEYVSSNLGLPSRRFGDYSKARMFQSMYREGSSRFCWVNRRDYSESVLTREDYSDNEIVIDIALVSLGMGIVALGISLSLFRESRRSAPGMEATSAQGDIWRLFVGIGFSLWMMKGGVEFCRSFASPMVMVLRAREWKQIPCVVVESSIKTYRKTDGEGKTHASHYLCILYEYQLADKVYQGDLYDFTTGPSSNYEEQKRIVDRYQVGSEALCFVNPKDPVESVIHREYDAGMVAGLVPFVSLLTGIAGVAFAFFGLRHGRKLIPREDDIFEEVKGPPTHEVG